MAAIDGETSFVATTARHLALNQKRLLKGLASELRGARPFAGAFIKRQGLGSASSSQRAIESLLNRDLIDRDNGSYLISDRFFPDLDRTKTVAITMIDA